jgi:hypothetical protein
MISEVGKAMFEVMPEFITRHCAPYKASFRRRDVHINPIAWAPSRCEKH